MIKSNNVIEIRQSYHHNFIQSIIRLYKNQNDVFDIANSIEINYYIHSIPVNKLKHLGKEIIIKWQTNIDNNHIFYTDSNGRDMQQRQLNYRHNYKINITNPISVIIILLIV